MPLRLTLLPDELAVCRLAAADPLPRWLPAAGFLSITRTAEELSIVCASGAVPDGTRAEAPWRALAVAGPLDFGLVGVLAALTVPLADAGVPIFALSTFDTDYVLVKAGRLAEAAGALRAAGHIVEV
jgi:hypothetical protein